MINFQRVVKFNPAPPYNLFKFSFKGQGAIHKIRHAKFRLFGPPPLPRCVTFSETPLTSERHKKLDLPYNKIKKHL